ncbi:hypothetical protein L9F63_001663 [Diploptera punctata]|uniref:Proline-rich protein PRCC n=1 Tax=Diploptera punctata TaxID=6984 RepID=A0AAD8A3P8_DIPPU|nr:hypothetical protein L9F63_001663 [Diploptera punctata]
MASLVAYGSSDESENESGNEDDYSPVQPEITVTKDGRRKGVDLPMGDDINAISENKTFNKSSLFSDLPLPKTSTSATSLFTDDSLLKNHAIIQKKQPVKITVPSLSEFKEEEEPEPAKKKLKPSSKGSGLFAVLPPPKHLTLKEVKRPLVPNVITKKPSVASLILKMNQMEKNGSHVDDNNSKGDQPLTFDSEFKPSPWTTAQAEWQDDEPRTSCDDYISVQQDNLHTDLVLQQLCGRRGKRHQQEMQLIDVSGDAIMPDPNEWLTKQLTQEQATKVHSHSHRKNDGPTTQQRRKHQITYLAFQAKENELELKNQWSQNRMSRKQTQSKYGF